MKKVALCTILALVFAAWQFVSGTAEEQGNANPYQHSPNPISQRPLVSSKCTVSY